MIFFVGQNMAYPRPVRFATPVYAAVRHARYPSPIGEVFYV
ncbi:hypothetical protein [Heyndrickxia coagulans]|nr:hypothetical protein [Heyndrickxia coagulans]